MIGIEDHLTHVILGEDIVALVLVCHGGAVALNHGVVGALAAAHGDQGRLGGDGTAGAVEPGPGRPAVEGQGHIAHLHSVLLGNVQQEAGVQAHGFRYGIHRPLRGEEFPGEDGGAVGMGHEPGLAPGGQLLPGGVFRDHRGLGGSRGFRLGLRLGFRLRGNGFNHGGFRCRLRLSGFHNFTIPAGAQQQAQDQGRKNSYFQENQLLFHPNDFKRQSITGNANCQFTEDLKQNVLTGFMRQAGKL